MSAVSDRVAKVESSSEALPRRLDAVGWGLPLVLTGGVLAAPKGLAPEGLWLLGFGLILAGVDAARRLNGLAASGFALALGLLAMALGVSQLAGPVLGLAIELPVFAVWLVALGVIVLARELVATISR